MSAAGPPQGRGPDVAGTRPPARSDARGEHTSLAAASLRLGFPVIVWGLHFGTIYALTALACARAAPQTVPWTIGVATLAATALLVATIVRQWPRRSDFIRWLTAALAAAALVGIVWEALPVLLVPPCA